MALTTPSYTSQQSVKPSASILVKAKQWVSAPENGLLLLLLALAAIPLCYELGRHPVQLWDESRLAVNAAEMAQNGNLLVTHFENLPDHWNTKPPLLIWLIALCFKVFGYNTWALRLPTLVATVSTVVLLFRFAARDLRKPLAGFFGGLVLVTSIGYVRTHIARTGDYDALLSFWQVVVWVSFYRYLESGRSRALLWLAVGLTAAVLTKSVAGLLGVPGLVLYSLIRGKFVWLLRQRQLYMAAAAFVVIVGAYFFGRELLDPGYLQEVSANDLGGRYLTDQQIHGHPWDYYFVGWQEELFRPWLLLFLPALLVLLLQPEKRLRWAGLLLACFITSWITIISTAASKLGWYDAPIYPAASLVVGFGITLVMQAITAQYIPNASKATTRALGLCVLLFLFYFPYKTVIHRIINERRPSFESDPTGCLGRYVDITQSKQPQLDKLTVLHAGGYDASLNFYKIAYQQQKKDLTIYPGNSAKNLEPGTVTLLCNPDYRARIDSAFQVMELDKDESCQTLLLLNRK